MDDDKVEYPEFEQQTEFDEVIVERRNHQGLRLKPIKKLIESIGNSNDDAEKGKTDKTRNELSVPTPFHSQPHRQTDKSSTTKPNYETEPCIPLNCGTDEIVRKYLDEDTYEAVALLLIQWKKSGKEWDEFRRKIDATTLMKMSRAFLECRRMGLFVPRGIYRAGIPRITFMQARRVVTRRPEPHLKQARPEFCDYCERVCDRRDENRNLLKDQKECWRA